MTKERSDEELDAVAGVGEAQLAAEALRGTIAYVELEANSRRVRMGYLLSEAVPMEPQDGMMVVESDVEKLKKLDAALVELMEEKSSLVAFDRKVSPPLTKEQRAELLTLVKAEAAGISMSDADVRRMSDLMAPTYSTLLHVERERDVLTEAYGNAEEMLNRIRELLQIANGPWETGKHYDVADEVMKTLVELGLLLDVAMTASVYEALVRSYPGAVEHPPFSEALARWKASRASNVQL